MMRRVIPLLAKNLKITQKKNMGKRQALLSVLQLHDMQYYSTYSSLHYGECMWHCTDQAALCSSLAVSPACCAGMKYSSGNPLGVCDANATNNMALPCHQPHRQAVSVLTTHYRLRTGAKSCLSSNPVASTSLNSLHK